MKRFGNLWPQIIDFQNLWQAARQAQRGKRFRPNVLAFNHQLEQNLLQLQHELQTKTYQPGEYHTFEITDPKPRLISAAPYRDRVIHHALCNVIVPLIERSFIDDSYANRIGRGTHRALKRAVHFAGSSRYVLQCDVQKYFPSLDHSILKAQLRQRIKCRDTLWLIDTIIDNSNPQTSALTYFPGDTLLTPLERRAGLPIGNLTSQFFANVYLNGLDHFIKEQLHIRKYLRYVDDFLLFAEDRQQLVDARAAINTYLTELRLNLHPAKTQLFETQHGLNFVGFRLMPIAGAYPREVYIRVRNDNLQRARRRCKYLQQAYASGAIDLKPLVQRLQSWEAHLMHGDTHRLRRRIFDELIFHREEAEGNHQETAARRSEKPG
ncbi:MAG: reverse transcriptase domain-containing protein [Spirulina sp.]